MFDRDLAPPALAGLHAELDHVLTVDAAGGTDEQVASELAGLIAARARVEAALAARLAVFDARALASHDGCPSTRTWLAGRCRLSGADAGHLIAVARAVGSHPSAGSAADVGAASSPAVLGRSGYRGAATPVAAGELAAGRTSAEQVRIVAAACARASDADTAVPPEVITTGETMLTEQTRVLDPQRLRVLADAWLEAVTPEVAALDAAGLHQRRCLHASPGFDGMVEVSGRLDPQTGQSLLAVLDPLSRPLPDDRRSAAQRRADALGQACQRLLDAATLPEVAAERPHLVLTVDTTVLDRYRRSQRSSAPGHSAPATMPAGLPAVADPAQLPAPPRFERTGHPDWPTLLALACDATISRVVLGPAHRPLDIGWRTRQWTAWQRRAITTRDQHCTWPGCTRPPTFRQIDHIRSWQDGGPTDVDNGRLLCSYHHHLRHDSWQLHGTPGGTWTAIPPPDWPRPGARHRQDGRRRRSAAAA